MDEFQERFARYTIGCDPFDLSAFQQIRTRSSKFDELMDAKKLRTVEELGQDVFDAFYKYVPELKPEEAVHPEYGFNRSLMEKAMGTQEYERLRAVTALQDAESAIASEVILDELLRNLPEEDLNAANDYADAVDRLRQAQGQVEAIEDLPKVPKRVRGILKTLKSRMPKLQAAARNAQAAFDVACANPTARAAFRAAIGAATEELDRVNDFAGGWGMESSRLTKVPPGDRIELMRRIKSSAKIRQLQKLLGRFRRLAFHKRYTRIVREPSEVVDVTRGGDVSHVISSELAALAIPEREDEFYAKLVQGTLITYDLRSTETVGRGPIIVLIDNSGSMSVGEDGVTREMWAKAVGLAMAEIALKDGRDIEFINFSYSQEMSKHVVPRGLPPAERLRRLIAVAEEFYGGGTDFEAPLDEAVADVDKQAFRKADVVLITDGIADFSEAFLKRFREVKEKKAFRLHAVLIGGTSESVAKVCDAVHDLYDLVADGDRVAGDLFESL